MQEEVGYPESVKVTCYVCFQLTTELKSYSPWSTEA